MFLSVIHNLMLKPFLLLKEQKAAWCTELVNVDIFLFVFRGTREVDILSIYANWAVLVPLECISLAQLFCMENFAWPHAGCEESTEKSEPQGEPVFSTEKQRLKQCLRGPGVPSPKPLPLTSHWISLYFSFQNIGKKVTVFSTSQSALRLLDEKHRYGYLQ